MAVTRSGLIGRQAERDVLREALETAERGSGSVVLIGGEAGVGKTRLADEVLEDSEAIALRGAAGRAAGAPYGPVAAALRSYLRANPKGLDDCGPLRPHLALILPGLGGGAPASDRATLVEAIRAALVHIARQAPAVLVLDDLHWSDEGAPRLLAGLADQAA